MSVIMLTGNQTRGRRLSFCTCYLWRNVHYTVSRSYSWLKGTGVVEGVSSSYSMDTELVSDYFQETMIGCAKDPTYSRGRNLVTYAVDLLMESNSDDNYLSGVQILGAVLAVPSWSWDSTIHGQPYLIKKLLTRSASCGRLIQRLIETIGTESSDSWKIREHAASIVAQVAHVIHLRSFPGGIKFLSFLFNTVKDYRGPLLESGSSSLVVQGLRIIQNLTVVEDNCTIIIQTAVPISEIAAPLISNQFHEDRHDGWSELAEELLKLMSRLMATQEGGEELRLGMSGNDNAIISTLERTVACPKCEVLVTRRAIQILLDLSMDPSDIMDRGNSSIKFTWILLHIFLVSDDCFDETRGSMHWMKKSCDISRLAAEKLLAMLLSQSEGSITTMLLSVCAVVADLTGALVDAENISSALQAAEILEQLCLHYTSDDEYLKELKKAMVIVMPMVLREIPPDESTREVIHASARGNNVQSRFPDNDLESGDVSHGNVLENISSCNQHIGEQPKSPELQLALVFLCKTIWLKWYDEDDLDVTRQLDEVAAKICAEQGKPVKSFPGLLFEAESVIIKWHSVSRDDAHLSER